MTDPAVQLVGLPVERHADPRRVTGDPAAPPPDSGAVAALTPDSGALAADIGRTVDLLVEVARLQEALAAARSHLAHLEGEVARWQERADAEVLARARERAEAHERERELIRILHRQIVRAQMVDRWTVTIADASLTIPEPETPSPEPL